MTKNKKIKIVASSVKGQFHKIKKLPCQDCYKYAIGSNLVAVVSDGAGSAKYGKIGAKYLCQIVCNILKNAKFEKIEQAIIRAVDIVRQNLCLHRLNKTKDEKGLEPFSATLVGVVYKDNKGVFFHIGDGAALSLHEDKLFVASRPENGNFSCETYFFTQDEWKDNLRFTKIEEAKTIMLMSDGVTSFAFNNDYKNIEHKFIDPIDKFLSGDICGARAEKALRNTLNNSKAQRLNSDDKTLVWIKVA